MKKYRDKILEGGNGLIDVAVPRQPKTSEERSRVIRTITAQLEYVWDTYVARTGRRVVMLGAGVASFAMVSLMKRRQEDVQRLVSCVFLLQVDREALPSVGSEFEDWYFKNTTVLVADSDPALDCNMKCMGRVTSCRKYCQSS